MERHDTALRTSITHHSLGSILHDEKWSTIFYPKLEDTDDMGMRETSHQARLAAKFFTLLICEPSVQHFDGRLGVEVQMFTQVDIGKATLSDQIE